MDRGSSRCESTGTGEGMWLWAQIRGIGIAYHVTDTGGRETIQTSLDLGDRDDVKILGARVVGAVHDGSDRETKRHAELAAAGATSASLRHGVYGWRACSGSAGRVKGSWKASAVGCSDGGRGGGARKIGSLG